MEDQLTVALRVIKAVSYHWVAAPADVALLRAWAAADDRNREPDELACLIIEGALRRRKATSTMSAGASQAQAAGGE